MINQDPEKYFESFTKWVEEEERKIEKEKKSLKETDTNSEIEYDEEEKALLNGEIDDQQKKEEIAERIEVKVNVKKKSWSLRRWLKEQYEWLKTKAKLLRKKNKVDFDQKANKIRQEIKTAESSSNQYIRQAYEKNKNQAEALLKELKNVANENTNNANTLNNNKFPMSWVVGGVALAIIGLGVLFVVKNNKKKKLPR
jgi:hypothetical protein